MINKRIKYNSSAPCTSVCARIIMRCLASKVELDALNALAPCTLDHAHHLNGVCGVPAFIAAGQDCTQD